MAAARALGGGELLERRAAALEGDRDRREKSHGNEGAGGGEDRDAEERCCGYVDLDMVLSWVRTREGPASLDCTFRLQGAFSP